jgi:twitching motility protein PilT
MNLNEILTLAVKARGSDIHFKSGQPPIVRIDGKLHPMSNVGRLTPDIINERASGIMNERQKMQFAQHYETDLAHGIPGLGRFRVSVYNQRGTTAMVFRSIPFTIPTLDS